MRTQIKKEITKSCKLIMGTESKTFKVVVKKSLMARRCAGCEEIFDMKNVNGKKAGVWSARMSGIAGRQGNVFTLDCCSFQCAHDLECGAWQKPKTRQSYDKKAARDYAEAGIVTVHVEYILGEVMYEGDLIKEWEARKPKTPILDVAFAEDRGTSSFIQP